MQKAKASTYDAHSMLTTAPSANLYKHFKRFFLSMHAGNATKKSKTVAMFFPKMLEQAKEEEKEETNPEDLEFLNHKRIHLVQKFKYLGTTIPPAE